MCNKIDQFYLCYTYLETNVQVKKKVHLLGRGAQPMDLCGGLVVFYFVNVNFVGEVMPGKRVIIINGNRSV